MRRQKPKLKDTLNKNHNKAAYHVITRIFETHWKIQLEQMGRSARHDRKLNDRLNRAYVNLLRLASEGGLAKHFDDFLQSGSVANDDYQKRLSFIQDVKFHTRYVPEQLAKIAEAKALAEAEERTNKRLGPFEWRLSDITKHRGEGGLCTRMSQNGVFLQDGPFRCHAPGAAICPISGRSYQIPEETQESSLPTALPVHDNEQKAIDQDEACCINESTNAAQMCQGLTMYASNGGHQGGIGGKVLNAATEHVQLHPMQSSSESLATHCTGFERQGDRRVLFPNDLRPRSTTSRAESAGSIIDLFMIMEVSQPDDDISQPDYGRIRQVTSCEREYRA